MRRFADNQYWSRRRPCRQSSLLQIFNMHSDDFDFSQCNDSYPLIAHKNAPRQGHKVQLFQ